MGAVPRSRSIRSVARAATLLKLLTEGPAGLGELAARAGLPKSTTHGLLATLVAEGLVEPHETPGFYRLRPLT
jgi:DNA-binding IclR family transcriptional regulator